MHEEKRQSALLDDLENRRDSLITRILIQTNILGDFANQIHPMCSSGEIGPAKNAEVRPSAFLARMELSNDRLEEIVNRIDRQIQHLDEVFGMNELLNLESAISSEPRYR